VSKSRGWLWPAAARKAHYFTDGRSLCGKFAAVGSEPTQADDPGGGPDDCADCSRKLRAVRRG
jgi:hypothetical protein